MKRTIRAFVLSTLSIAITMAILNLVSMLNSGSFTRYDIGVAAMMIGISSAFGAACILVIGIPTHLVLKQQNITAVMPYSLIGFISAFMFVLLFKPFGNDHLNYLLQQGMVTGIIGSVSATVFWYFAVKREKPNQMLKKDANNNAS